MNLRGAEHVVRASNFLRFVELDEFRRDWQSLGLSIEHDLWDLQVQIMDNPAAASVVRGTGGLRKLRFSPRSWNKGKSGAVRVCYVYFVEHRMVLLIMAYAKARKESLDDSEKREIQVYLQTCKTWLDKQNRRKDREHGKEKDE